MEWIVTVTVTEKHRVFIDTEDAREVARMVDDGEITTSSETLVGIWGSEVESVKRVTPHHSVPLVGYSRGREEEE